jgi:hypothetical protein
MHDEEYREAYENYQMGLADHHVMMEQAQREHDCERNGGHTIVTYTYRDWCDTGVPEGTVCEDCGKQFPDPPEIEYPEPNNERT